MCPKFKKFGLKKFNKSGCEESCTNYHPKACFEAMKSKTCNRQGCKFYHISGTKKTETAANVGNNVTQTLTQVQTPTQNSFSPIAPKGNDKELVFQKAKEPWELAIEKMAAQMEMLMKWQQIQINNQENLNFERNNYHPTPSLRPQTNWPTQTQTQSQGPYSTN